MGIEFQHNDIMSMYDLSVGIALCPKCCNPQVLPSLGNKFK